MSEWKKVKLGEISQTIQTGPFGSQLHQSDYSVIGIPVVMPKDIIAGNIEEASIARVEQHHIDRLSRHMISYGDILYARRGDVGKCAFTKQNQEGWLCGTGCLRVTINPDMANPKFVFFQLQKQETIGWITNHAIGSTMLNLNTTILSNAPVEIPSLRIQNRIVEILSRYDSLIENYQKQIKLFEEAAQRLYKEWFIDLHFPGHENTNIIDGVPEGWEKKKVNSIIELQSGFAFKSSTFDDNGAYKIVTIKNVKDGAFDGDNVSKIVAIPDKMPKHCILADGDILLSLTGNVGRVCIVNGKSYLLNQRVAKLATDYKAFTYCLFRSRDMFIEVNNLANGAAQQNVSPIRIGEMKILLPNSELLQEFESIVFKSIARIISLQSQLRLLTEARDRLLPKLMSGEITV